MKLLYTILFFASTFLLIVLTFLLFNKMGTSTGSGTLILVIAGIIASIVLMVFLLLHYFKLPPGQRNS